DHPVVDRDLAGADVGDAHRDEERADPVGPAGGVDRDALGERAGATEAGPEDDPRSLGLLALDPVREAGLVHRLARRDEPELDVAVGPADLLAVEDLARVEVADLAGDLAVDPHRVERLDHPDRGKTATQARPRGRDVLAERGDQAHAGHDHAPWLGRPGCGLHRTSFPVRTVAARATAAGSPRAEIAFETVIVSNSVRRISAFTVAPSISMSAHEAVGSPSKI